MRKSSVLTSPLEKQLAEQFGFPMQVKINENETGHFRIPFHNSEHMQTIMEKIGLKFSDLDVEK